MRYLLATLITFLFVIRAEAQNDSVDVVLRPVTAAYTAEIGGASIVNTYLSPLVYDGMSVALNYERMQAMRFNPDDWVMRLTSGIMCNYTENPARNAEIWRLVGNFSWGMTRRWRFSENITIGAGGSTTVDLGCVYSTRNGNNPVAVEASWTLNLTGYAAWNCSIGGLPVTLCYRPTMPLVGAFFSPDYGELLYEVYLGNHDNLVHGAWWGNYFSIENLITADFHFGNTCLRVGFRNNILSTDVNNLTTRVVYNAAVVGLSGEWLGLSSRKGLDARARMVSALY